MDILNNLTDALAGIPFDIIFQLLCLTLIVLAGPIVIAVLAFRGGDL
ncbi:MAG: photosystem II reaction center protein Ycf12/Psb30 [Pseudanabaenaceae cyanobacterium]